MIHSPNGHAASNEVVRDINKRIVLNLIRTRQPVSRADLARISGMQRSTVSLIVEELVQDDWVCEGATGRLPRGRRPTFLRLNDQRIIVGVDIRPSQITFGVSDVNGKFSSQEVIPTPPDPVAAVPEIIERIQRLLAAATKPGGVKVEGIGISVPGRFDPVSDRLIFAPNLRWSNIDLRGPIAAATGLDVEIENAASACVLAAIWFDGLEASRNLIVLTVSEGIGAGILVNGKLATGLNGMAGEFGHIPLDPNGPLCNCGGRGCWEMFGSNRAALRYYSNTDPIPDGLTFKDLLTLADQGNIRAQKALHRMAQFLGQGMRMITCGLAPERILVVGDLTLSWKFFGPILEEQLRVGSILTGSAPQLIPVHEGGQPRLRGTVALILQKHFGEVRS